MPLREDGVFFLLTVIVEQLFEVAHFDCCKLSPVANLHEFAGPAKCKE